MMAENAMNVVVIILDLTVLDSKIPIPVALVDRKEMLGRVLVVVYSMVTLDDTIMVPVTIAAVINFMVTVNLCPLGNIFILLIKI